MSRKISFYVCPNGLGHFRRVLSVSNALLGLGTHRIRIICSQKQFESRYFWNFERALAKNAVEFHIRTIPPECGWIDDGSAYRFERYLNWLNELQNDELLQDELIVSDNLAGVLKVRPDALLMGSFIWLDILQSHAEYPEVRSIIDFERQLLKENKTEMLCIRDMAMPSIVEYTRPVALSWFGEKRKSISNGEAILISAGDTGSYQQSYLSLLEELLSAGYQVFCDGRLYKAAQQANIPAYSFSFSEEEYRHIGLVVCRPGIGILTEALEREIPVIALDDEFNAEISYNAARVEALGFGMKHKLSDPSSIKNLIKEAINNHRNGGYTYLRNAPMGGAEEAAAYIADYRK